MDRDLRQKVRKLWKKRLFMGVSTIFLLKVVLLQCQTISKVQLQPVDDYESIEVKMIADFPQVITSEDGIQSNYFEYLVEKGIALNRLYTRTQDYSRSLTRQLGRLDQSKKEVSAAPDELHQLEQKNSQLEARVAELRLMRAQSARALENQLKELLDEGFLIQTLETIRTNSDEDASVALLSELVALEQQLNADFTRLRDLRRSWILLYVSTSLMLILIVLLSRYRLKDMAFMVHAYAFLPEYCVAELAAMEERLDAQRVAPFRKGLELRIELIKMFLFNFRVQFENTFLLPSNESVDD